MNQKKEIRKELNEYLDKYIPRTEIDIYKYVVDFIKKDRNKQLTLTDVVSSAFLVQHKETLINYGLFSTREKAENYINKNTDLFGVQEVKIA